MFVFVFKIRCIIPSNACNVCVSIVRSIGPVALLDQWALNTRRHLLQAACPYLSLTIDAVGSVPTLLQLTRHAVRRQLLVHTGGKSLVSCIYALPLPNVVKQYLLFADVRQCDVGTSEPYHCHFDGQCCCQHFNDSDDDIV